MSKLSTFNSLSLAVGAICLVSLAGSQNAVAADLGANPQMQAANLLHRDFTGGADTDVFQQFSGGKIYTSQELAQRILQPVTDVVVSDAGAGQSMAYESANPQLKAAHILSRNITCSPTAC